VPSPFVVAVVRDVHLSGQMVSLTVDLIRPAEESVDVILEAPVPDEQGRGGRSMTPRCIGRAVAVVAGLIAVWLHLVVIVTAMVTVYLNEPIF
ncbi:MAG: hypothetical protein ABR592_00295, partial [Nitriliruptorales bacterium]